jgi:hypothetical protein
VKLLGTVVSVVSGLLAAIAAYVGLGGPVPASTSYVDAQMHPLRCDVLAIRRHVNAVDLYQWQHDNPQPTGNVQQQIDALKTTLAGIDKRIADLGC